MIEDAVATLWEDLHRATLRNVELFYGAVTSLKGLKKTFAVQARVIPREAA